MSNPGPAGGLAVVPVTGIGEIETGADLGAVIAEHSAGLADGDVLAVTSKIVSKAEGRSVTGTTREDAITAEMAALVARRGGTRIVRTRHGFVMAAAGTDTSNAAPGTVLLLPVDPDASARTIRERIAKLTGINAAVLVTDTLGRAWRVGQTDVALGAAGIDPVLDLRDTLDSFGQKLLVTQAAIADEIASAAELVKGKAAGIPAAVVRGLGRFVLPAGDHGPGARALVRDEDSDMFRLGAREAVEASMSRAAPPVGGYADELAQVWGWLVDLATVGSARIVGIPPEPVQVTGPAVDAGRTAERIEALAYAYGHRLEVTLGD